MRLNGSGWASPRPIGCSPFAGGTLHDAMIATRTSNVELGRTLGLDERAIRRLRDPLHRSHVGQVETALRALGRRVVVEVDQGAADAPPADPIRRAA